MASENEASETEASETEGKGMGEDMPDGRANV